MQTVVHPLSYVLLFGFAAVISAAEPLKLPVTRDVWISAYPGEQDGNNGGAPRLKFKGIQEFSLLDFDSAALRGKRVSRAQLWLHLESIDAPLRRMTVSTVATPWEEGTGSGYAKGTGASFRWAKPDLPWNGPGSDVTSVVNSEAGTIWGFGDATSPDANGWQVIPVDPKVIEACADRRSHGVFVQDDVGSEYERDGEKFKWKLFPNRMVASREMNKTVAPYFVIWVEGDASQSPVPAKQTPLQTEKCVLPAATVKLPNAEKSVLTDLMGVPVGIHLYAAKNEAVTFFIERNENESVEVEAAGLESKLLSLVKAGSAGGVADVLTDSIQKGRVVCEIYLPHSVRSGAHSVTVRIGKKSLAITLHVWDFTLPDQLTFVPEMNAYGLPVPAEEEVAWYRMAHEHRLNLNVLRYGWNGRVADGCAPVKKANAWDWEAWDRRFGPLLDGTAFSGLPRTGVPIDAFYLPLNEHWPADVHRHFKGGYWVEDAFDESYWNEFSTTAREFAEHAAKRGWTKTWLQFYLNNKVYFKEQRGTWSSCSAPWVFDEPVNTQDFWALRRYGQEFNRAARSIAPNAVFRCDISRPEWQRDLLDGVSGMEVISGALRPYRERIEHRQARYGTMFTFYGTTAPPTEFPVQPVAWCLDAWCLGADGVLPWQTIGTKESWDKPDALSLFYPARNPQDPVVSPSLRLKSYREGQQLVEYLTAYTLVTGQSRHAVAEAVREFLGLEVDLKKKNSEDAGTAEYKPAIAQKLFELRERLGAFLDSKHPEVQKQSVMWMIKTDESPRAVVE